MNLIKLTCLIFIAFMMWIKPASAQLKFEKRIEFELKNGYENEKVYKSSLGYFIMESIADKKVNNQVEVRYDLYDSLLELKKTVSLQIPVHMRYGETYYNDENIYNFYYRKNEFIITHIKIEDLTISKTNGKIPRKARLQDMKILGSSAWFYAILKGAPFIYRVDLKNGMGKMVPVNFGSTNPKKIMMKNYQLLEKSNELLVFLSRKIQKGVYKLEVMRFKEGGSLDKTFQLSESNQNVISSASAYRISNNKVVYTGTYSKNAQSLSEGLFFCESLDDKTNYINYYNFLDLKNFLSYLPERRQEKIEKKRKKREAQGKEFILNYSIANHDIMVLPDGYLFLGEAYYPTYRSEVYTTYQTINGVSTPTTSYHTVFDGYQYTHAVLAKFSIEGQLVWDVCFEMYPNHKPYNVERFIAISEKTENSIGMVFTSGSNIVSKIVDFNGNVLSDKKWELIETGKETDKTKWTVSESDYWYSNYFLVYGAQKIKNQEDKSKRKVFFVNKISY